MACIPLVLTTTVAISGGIYKWTDENGQINYSQVKPSQNTTKEIKYKNNNEKKPEPQKSSDRFNQAKCTTLKCTADKMENERLERERNWKNAKLKKQTKPISLQEKNKQLKDYKDKLIIAKCKKRRETYCDEGADKIKDEEMWKRIKQEQQKQFRRDHPYIP